MGTAALHDYLRAMPKIELHVHFEGSMQPETLLALAKRNGTSLPYDTVEELRAWFAFTDFPHFARIYATCADTIHTPDDLEFAARAFLQDRAAQHIRYSEVTYTGYERYRSSGMSWDTQMDAINRARAWGEAELGVTMQLIVDIARELATPDEALTVADWVIAYHGRGVAALGLGGYEVGFPATRFFAAMDRARTAGVPLVLHAGETVGPESIWHALDLGAVRIGHGVRCLEDPSLVEVLRERQIPLEVCPTSNVCLNIVPTLADHPIQRLIDAGLNVTLNSDDPPMFGTSLNEEYTRTSDVFGFTAEMCEQFVINAIRAALLPAAERAQMEQEYRAEWARLRPAAGLQQEDHP